MPVFVDLSLLWRWTSTYQAPKGWVSQKCELQSFVFQKVPIWQWLQANQLGRFEYNFRCLKWFFRKLSRKLRSAFFLKLRPLKIRLLVTWLKCLINGVGGLAGGGRNVHSMYCILFCIVIQSLRESWLGRWIFDILSLGWL